MSLENFLIDWDKEYKSVIDQISLFQIQYTKEWSSQQKIWFAKWFYHVRGHFHDFLWYIGNHAEDKETKDIILKNISEELNSSSKSHEQLYIDFASSVGANLERELIDEKNYLPFIQDFNRGHLKWLHTHDADERFVALSAYERLDNIDYAYLMNMLESLNVSRSGQIFFKIHTRVAHFESTKTKLQDIYNIYPEKIATGFNFIKNHQLKMWKNLSDHVFDCNF